MNTRSMISNTPPVSALLEVSLKTQLYSSPVGPHVDGTILPR